MGGPADEPRLTTSCPRCGYDLRGTVATWTDSCPLAGVCTECGLELSWAETLRPDRFGEHWNIEREPRNRRIVLAAARTWLRSFMPWWFWSRLTMSHPIRSDRLAQYLVLLALSLLLLYPVIQVTGAVIVRYRHGQLIPQGIANSTAITGYLTSRQQFGEADARTRVFKDKVPPETRQYLAQLDDAQRAQVLAMSRQALPQWQNMRLGASYGDAILEALLFPFRTESSHTKIVEPYTPPAYLYDEVSRDLQVQGDIGPGGTTWKWYGGGQWGARLSDIPASLFAVVVFALVMPLGFSALPVSRRRAQVRWWHIVRITIYSMFAIHASAAASVLYLWICYLAGWHNDLSTILIIVVPAGAIVAIVAHWAVAIKRYLRMPHGALVSISLAILAALLMAVALQIWIGWFR